MLKIKDLNLNLGKFNLKNLNLNMNLGEYFVILGPSGSGKTVLLETIAGLYSPSGGEILYKDKDMTRLEPENRDIGFVYQNYEFFPHMTIRENISFA